VFQDYVLERIELLFTSERHNRRSVLRKHASRDFMLYT